MGNPVVLERHFIIRVHVGVRTQLVRHTIIRIILWLPVKLIKVSFHFVIMSAYHLKLGWRRCADLRLEYSLRSESRLHCWPITWSRDSATVQPPNVEVSKCRAEVASGPDLD